jgi:O-antigen/teichoic acid export membrane protein
MIIIPYINWCAFLTVNAIYDYEIRQTLYILTSLFFAQILLNTLSAVLSAFQETAVVSVLGLLGQIFVLLILLGVRYFKDPSLAVLCFSFMGAPVLVMCGATIYLYHGRLCTVAPSIRYFNKNCIYSLCDMGLKFFLIQLQVIVLFQSTNIIIAHLANQEVVAQYNIAYKYIGAAEMLLVIFITPLWPAFTEAFARKDFNWMRSVYKKFSILYLYFLLLIILMIVFSPIVYHVWLGNKIEIPVSMTIFIGIYMVVRCWDSIQVYMLNGIGDIKMQMYVTLIGLIAHIPLSFIIGKYMGALGVTCSMTIIVAIYSLVFTVKLRKIIFHAVQKTTAV